MIHSDTLTRMISSSFFTVLICSLSIFTLIPFKAISQSRSMNTPSPRVLVHILDYVAQDYSGAVENGKILKQSEFNEQLQFVTSAESLVKELEVAGVLNQNSNLSGQVADLKNQIKQKADSKKIALIAHHIKNEVIKETGMKVAPITWPNLAAGHQLFETNCVTCHGKNGDGDGKLAAALNPKPADLSSGVRIASISPFQVYNTVSIGIEGTAMPSFGQKLSDKQLWAIAFYVKSLKANIEHPELENTQVNILNSLRKDANLEKVATLNDPDLENFLRNEGVKNSDIAAANLRLAGDKGITTNSLELALSYLDQVDREYKSGEIDEARRKAVLAYLDGIEPVEPSLRSHAPSLTTTLEDKMTTVRSNIEGKAPASVVTSSINDAKVYINKAKKILQTKSDSPWFEFLMAASILLREGLEAFLIILAILGVIKAVGDKKAALWVHSGWILAILFGVAAWFFTDWIIQMGFGPVHRELMEGSVSLIAVVVLLYVGFWLHSKTEVSKWKEFIEVRVKNMTSGGNLFGLATIAFFAVFREALESVLFLSALTIEGGPGSKVAVGSGAVAAIVTVLLLGAVVLRFSARLPIRKLFKYSSFMLGFLSVVLAGKGIHSLQEIGWLSVTSTPIHLNINLIGLYPTMQTLVAQLVILSILVVVWNYPTWKTKREVVRVE